MGSGSPISERKALHASSGMVCGVGKIDESRGKGMSRYFIAGRVSNFNRLIMEFDSQKPSSLIPFDRCVRDERRTHGLTMLCVGEGVHVRAEKRQTLAKQPWPFVPRQTFTLVMTRRDSVDHQPLLIVNKQGKIPRPCPYKRGHTPPPVLFDILPFSPSHLAISRALSIWPSALIFSNPQASTHLPSAI